MAKTLGLYKEVESRASTPPDENQTSDLVATPAERGTLGPK